MFGHAWRVAFVSVLAITKLACEHGPRDEVPASRAVRMTPAGSASGADVDTYVHVARRLHGVVALAEARHMKDDEARAIVERIADDLERCASDLESQQLLVEGAARVVAVAGPKGTPALNVRFAPGDAVAQNALLCIVAPIRATPLPPSTSGAPAGLAIEATWGPLKPRAPGAVTSGDAG